MTALAPCPFCGRADAPYVYQTRVAEYKGVECEHDRGGCGAGLIAEGEEAAITAWNRRAPAQLDQAREEERERAAKILEQAIEEGYDVPARKVDQCEHGKFGWEDCVACYEVVLTSIAAAIRTPDRTDGGAA